MSRKMRYEGQSVANMFSCLSLEFYAGSVRDISGTAALALRLPHMPDLLKGKQVQRQVTQ